MKRLSCCGLHVTLKRVLLCEKWTPFKQSWRTCVNVQTYLKQDLPKHPNKEVYEPFWYRFWEKQKLFQLKNVNGEDKVFSMILPPPNITGNLHLGHALTVAIQDALFRYHKMTKEYTDCVWIPGYDHAGIATHLVLDKQLFASQGRRAQELSPQEFKQFAENWRDERIFAIRNQLKKLGASLDFSKEYFTLNDSLRDAVNQAFIQLYDSGLIYRAEMIVNWSYFLKSTISDIEVDWLHVSKPTKLNVPGFNRNVEFGVLHMFSYPVSETEEITVGTTRIETMLADVAVAVHPDDNRYSHLIGKQFKHPLVNSTLKIIADPRVDPNFCTGAVKITPAYSAIDNEIARDHQLEIRTSLNHKGLVECKDLKPEYEDLLNGRHRYDAKERIIDILKRLELYKESNAHNTKVPVCSRSGDIVEQRVLSQWFLNLRKVSEELEHCISTDEVKITPLSQSVKMLKWINEERDWCISRQIRWGHEIPAYEIKRNERILGHIAALSEKEAMDKATAMYSSGITLRKDEDVLDTWFSSALLPFTVFGWPVSTTTFFKKCYPLTLMETGYDILNFWVLKMLLLGKCLTGDWPFRKVYLHGMVCDAYGKKMTKSIGNVIDPNDVIDGVSLNDLKQKSHQYRESGILTEEQMEVAIKNQERLFPNGIAACGADALRMSLYQKKDQKNEQIRLDVESIVENRNYTNKMWQAYRFYKLFHGAKPTDHRWILDCEQLFSQKEALSGMDLWILSSLTSFIENCTQALNACDFHKIHDNITKFWVECFCDFYLESLKVLLYAEAQDSASFSNSLNVLTLCLKTSFTTIHPFMPFITEELFQRLNKDIDFHCDLHSILEEKFPTMKDWSKWRNPEIEETMEVFKTIVRSLRNFKDDYTSSVEEEKELSVNVFLPESAIKNLNKFICYLPKFSRAKVSFVSLESYQNPSPIEIEISSGFIVALAPSASLLSRRLSIVNQKLEKTRSKIDDLRLRQLTRRNKQKLMELEATFSTLKTQQKQLEEVQLAFESIATSGA